MSVLPHEGTHPILYGTVSVPAGTRVHTAYLARPDLAGPHPSVVLAAGRGGVTSAVKDVCRRLARHGVAVLAPVSDGSIRPLRDGIAYLRRGGTEWSHPGRVAVAGLGEGAAAAAASPAGTAAAVVVYPRFGAGDDVGFPVPLLGLMVKGDPSNGDTVPRLRDANPGAEIVVYKDAAFGFLDVGAPGYDEAAAADAIRRIAGFITGRTAGATASV